MAFPQDPLGVVVELWYGGAWQDITHHVYLRDLIKITRGRRDEASQVDAGLMQLTLNNRDGRYSPRNPMSPLYGLIGRNTPIRVRVGDLPAEPAAVLVDTFQRTVASGWGTADTGQAWTPWTAFGGSAADFAVTPGGGTITLPSAGTARVIRTDAVSLADLEMELVGSVPSAPAGTTAYSGLFLIGMVRVAAATSTYIACVARILVDTGLPGGQGRRVACNIYQSVGGILTGLGNTVTVPELTYQPGVPLRMRIQAIGREVRMRVWTDGQPEPSAWHNQAYTEDITAAGGVAVQAQLDATAAATTVPLPLRVTGVSVRPPTPSSGAVRFLGEVSAWPSRWDTHTAGPLAGADEESPADAWAPIEAAGILRRLDQGAAPIQSLMRRFIPSVLPIAYWPMEEGAQGQTRVDSAAPTAGPLTVSGLNFAQDGDLPGSNPLPHLGTGASMRSATVPAVTTTSWSVGMLFRIPESSFPTTTGNTLLQFTTAGTAVTWTITAETSSGARRLRLVATDSDGAELVNTTASHEASLAGGGPGLLDDWRLLVVRAEQAGAGVSASFVWQAGTGTWGNNGTFSGSVGRFARIATVFSDALTGASIGHVSAWGVAYHPAYYDGTFSSMAGRSGETARYRVRRLAAEDDIPVTISGPAITTVGPQPIDTWLSAVRAAVDAQRGLLAEQRDDLALTYRARELFYNQEPALVLDYTAGHISEPFEPAEDDQRLRNDITVSRTQGSSARAVLEEGPLSVLPPPDGVGRYDSSLTLNHAVDGGLEGVATWELHRGTVDEPRFPAVRIDLARNPDLIEAVTELVEGDKVAIVNGPVWLPPGTSEQILEGYEETIGMYDWDVILALSPASPWTVGEIGHEDPDDDTAPCHVDTDGTQVYADHSATDTGLIVLTTAGPEWATTHGPTPTAAIGDYPVDVRFGGEVATVGACEPMMWDAFDRTMSGGWGTTPSAIVPTPSWSLSGGSAAERSVAAGQGRVVLGDALTHRIQYLTSWTVPTCEQLVTVTVPAVATGASMRVGIAMRISGADWYEGRIDLSTAGAVGVEIARSGVSLTGILPTGLTYTAGTVLRIRARVDGQRVRGRVWLASQPEPGGWQADHTVTSGTITTGQLGVTASRASGNTNVNPQFAFSAYQVVTPQLATVIRSVNNITKSHVSGTDLRLADPAIVAL